MISYQADSTLADTESEAIEWGKWARQTKGIGYPSTVKYEVAMISDDRAGLIDGHLAAIKTRKDINGRCTFLVDVECFELYYKEEYPLRKIAGIKRIGKTTVDRKRYNALYLLDHKLNHDHKNEKK